MIRCFDIGRQLAVDETFEGEDENFCFYDTITNKFIEIGSDSLFNSMEDFNEACEFAYAVGLTKEFKERLEGLIPMKFRGT